MLDQTVNEMQSDLIKMRQASAQVQGCLSSVLASLLQYSAVSHGRGLLSKFLRYIGSHVTGDGIAEADRGEVQAGPAGSGMCPAQPPPTSSVQNNTQAAAPLNVSQRSPCTTSSARIRSSMHRVYVIMIPAQPPLSYHARGSSVHPRVSQQVIVCHRMRLTLLHAAPCLLRC